MADARTRWQEATRDLLAKIDIEATYRSFGVQFPANPRARITGWMPCHAFGRKDDSPSAEINVGDGPSRGRYRDFGGDGTTRSLFDFAAEFGPGYGPQWRDARRKFAADLKFELPKGEEGLVSDRLDLFKASPGMLLGYAQAKPPIRGAAIQKCGGTGAHWPCNAKAELQQTFIVFPSFGEGLLDVDPIGYGCVSSNAGKIRKFKGKGVEPDLLKTMTLGSPGLMNVHALKRLAEARVVWIVEGITDMLSVQSVIPEWQDREHVVLTTGACTYHPRSEWLQYFAGKIVLICMDADLPGQTAAKVWAAAMVGVAGETKIVPLPYDVTENHGKDLRDFLTEEVAGERHQYKDMLALAEGVPPISAGDESQTIERHMAILQQLGCIVTGQIEGTPEIEIYSEKLAKKSRIKNIASYTYVDAMRDLGGETIERFVAANGSEPQPGQYLIHDVRCAIAREGGKEFLTRQPAIGAGIWRVKDHVVLVGYKSCEIWDGKGLESIASPAVYGQRVDFATEPWYDRDHLGNLLQLSAERSWCEGVFDEATALFKRWDNWRHRGNPGLVTGLVLASWIQTLWAWRPQVGVLGPTTCGKSMLIEDCLKGLFGKLECYNSKSTEAGIRQQIENSARVLLIDEFEEDSHRSQILTLLRTASRAGKSLRGTSNQKGISFGLRHIAWVAAIELGLHAQADRNRFILLELKPLPPGSPSNLVIPPAAELAALGQKLLAVAIRHTHNALAIADELKRVRFGVDRRLVESFSAPAAMMASVYGMSRDEAIGALRIWLEERDFSAQEESEEERLLRAIYEAAIILPGGKKASVSDVISGTAKVDHEGGPLTSRDQILRTIGIRLVDEGKDEASTFFVHNVIRQELLGRTAFSGQDISQILLRIEGADRRTVWMSHSARGVLIPQKSIDGLIGEIRRPVETY